MADQKTDSKSNDPAATQTPLTSVYTSNLPAILDHFGISLAVSTYQAGKVTLVRSDGGGINTITFLINPAYTMADSLDGLTSSRATSDREARSAADAQIVRLEVIQEISSVWAAWRQAAQTL